MIVIQTLLVLGVIVVLGWFLANPKSHQVHAWAKILLLLFTILAIVVIVSPSTADSIAHWVGVGRGADLLLYLLTLSFIFVVLNLYIKNKEEQKRFATIVRRLAVLEADMNTHNKQIKK